MATMDEIHGQGAGAEFRSLLDTVDWPIRTYEENPDESQVYILWGTPRTERAEMQVRYAADRWHFLKLRAVEDEQQAGLLGFLCVQLPDWFRAKGVRVITLAPNSERARQTFTLGGFVPSEEYGGMECRLDVPGLAGIQQYGQWVKAGKPPDSVPAYRAAILRSPRRA